MKIPRSPMIVLPLAAAMLVSACGSSHTATTGRTAVASTPASAVTGATTGATGQPTGASAKPTTTKRTNTPTATSGGTAATQPAKPKTSAAKPKTSAAKPKTTSTTPRSKKPVLPPPKHVFPAEGTHNFMVVCTAAGESTASCECIIAKFEGRNVDEGISLSELLGVEVSMKDHIPLSKHGKLRQYVHECRSA
jgi:hypothetical protein